MAEEPISETRRLRREERLALGIVFGALGAAALASVFVALSPPMGVRQAAKQKAPTLEAHRADLAIDVEAATVTARAAAERGERAAAEAAALAERARGARRGATFARVSLGDGKTYEGDAQNGIPEGLGIVRGGPIAFGAGFFVGGVRGGPGVDCSRPDCTGASYFGDFRANAPTGAARIVFPDGAIYRGDVRDGAPDGFGELIRADGSRYAGAFTAGRRNGHGVDTAASGAAKAGFWTGDQLSEALSSS